MKVTIGQINTTNGDIEGNIAKIIDAIEKAKADGSDIVVFPEVVTHGYTSQDWFQDHDIIEHSLNRWKKLFRQRKELRPLSAQFAQRTTTTTAAVV